MWPGLIWPDCFQKVHWPLLPPRESLPTCPPPPPQEGALHGITIIDKWWYCSQFPLPSQHVHQEQATFAGFPVTSGPGLFTALSLPCVLVLGDALHE